MNHVPIDRSYWVEPGLLLAGAFPGSPDENETDRRIGAFLDAGIRTFVNLMFPDEVDHDGNLFRPYAPVVEAKARVAGFEARCLRFPIRDMSTPRHETMDEILAAVHDSHASGAPAYVHCWGGKGRTGQVVGVHLIAQGRATAQNFVERIAELRRNDPGGGFSPETPAQIGFVRCYTRERGLEVRP